MKLVEKHLIKSSKSVYAEIDNLAFLSKNLFNCAVYQCRQAFFEGKPVPNFNQLYHLLKDGRDYKALPAKVSQLVIKQVSKSFKSYLAAKHQYKKDSSKFLGQPALPHIVNRLLENKITLLVIGKNDNWKQKVNLGKKTNQKFTAIPHATLINQLIYKCQLVGIKVITTGEAYTSKCSFLDLEPIKKQVGYLGKRIKRGLFRAANGRVYSAEQNGSLNIIRNAVGDSLFQGQPISRLVVSPVRIKPYQANCV